MEVLLAGKAEEEEAAGLNWGNVRTGRERGKGRERD